MAIDILAAEKTVSKKSFRVVFWTEIVTLELIALLTIAPLRAYPSPLGIDATQMVHIYYGLSLAIIIISQVLYMWPINKLRITNKTVYAVGMFLLVSLIYLWLTRASARVLDFSGLEKGEVLGPAVLAISLPVIQAFVAFSSTTLGTATPSSVKE